MKKVIDALVNIVFALGDLISKLDEWFSNALRFQMWAVGVAFGLLWYVVIYVYDAVNWIGEHAMPMMDSLFTAGGLPGQGTLFPSAFSQGLAFLNSIVPLSELIGFTAFIVPLWLVAQIIRMFKSWIPTVA